MKRNKITTFFMIFIFFYLCSSFAKANNPPHTTTQTEFGSYWFQGKAEITRYELHQVRYGQIHEGDAVLIFVTEDFLPEKQVKYEYGPPPENLTKVLKLNFTRKFYTGIYPYSVMSSVFTPIDGNSSLKLTTSVQEWCGHTFMQLNNRKRFFQGRLFSYFQKEGDSEFKLDKVLLEDEVWTRLRLNPEKLPIGEIRVIPGSQYQRFLHIEPAVYNATATRNLKNEGISEYKIEYSDLKRTLIIRFNSEFPYEITEWEEIYPPIGGGIKRMTTKAVKTHSLLIDYWNKHGVGDRVLLEKLGLK